MGELVDKEVARLFNTINKQKEQAEKEKQRAEDAEAGWAMFSKQLNDALEKQKRGQKEPEAEWDEHDYEKLLKESDARTDKYLEL